MLLDYKEIESKQIYKVMSQSIIPRPIAWIVTEDDGIVNVAPFSYFTPLSSNPPSVVVSIGHKADATPKDTLANIRKNKKATICFVNEVNLENMKNSANPHDKNESEIEIYNIETTKMLDNYPPIIASAQSAMFCDFHSEVPLEGKTVPIILEIKKQFFQDGLLSDRLDVQLDNIARVGKNFATMQDIVE
jgi:flavin reductase (DIM6/NTAB) family NADH-FMN oxidoreductase RutF